MVIHLNKRGQALVEFIIIAPLFVMMILCLVDFGKIYYTKNSLESVLNDIILLKNNGKDDSYVNKYLEDNIEDAKLDIKKEDNEISYVISKDVDISTPGLNIVLSSPYNVKVKRILPNE